MPDNAFSQEALQQANVDIAVLKVMMDQRDKELMALVNAVKDLSEKVDNIATTLTEARGGWRMLMLIGGISAAAGGILARMVDHIRFN